MTLLYHYNFITVAKQVHSNTNKFVLLQSGSVIYKRAKLTGAQYKHRVIFTLDGSHRVIFTLDDRITMDGPDNSKSEPFKMAASVDRFTFHIFLIKRCKL